MKYLRKFATEEEVANLEDLNVVLIEEGRKVLYNTNLHNSHLYFKNLGDGEMAIGFTMNDIEYCVEGGTWNTLTAGGTTPSVAKGKKIYFRALNPKVTTWGMGSFSSNASCSVGGNVMSLLYGDEYAKEVVLNARSQFNALFSGMALLKEASALKLPATTLSGSCYLNMFNNCKALTSAPELPATTLASDCYKQMFYGCTSLTEAPALPATALASNCYEDMFNNCKALTSAPELPATTLVSNCYKQMFQYCSKLSYIKALFTTEPSSTYTSNWLSDVASTGTFVKSKDATWDVVGANGVPSGWSIEHE